MSLHQTSLYLIQDHKFQDYGPDCPVVLEPKFKTNWQFDFFNDP